MSNYRCFTISAFVILSLISYSSLYGQGAQKVFNEYHDAYFDSLKKMDYPYALPILGKGAYKRGYDLPNAYGLSFTYFTQTQEIEIESTNIGFNGSEMVDMSGLITFGPTIAHTNAYTFRPDIWVLPFMSVYGVLGGGTTSTNVVLLAPVGFQTSQKFSLTTMGFGVTLNGAVGPIFISFDNNMNFAQTDVVVEPIPAFNSGVRIGHQIPDYKHPQRNLTVWTGIFYQSIKGRTEGSIPLQDVIPGFGDGLIFGALDDWANNLPLPQRLIAKQIIDKMEEAAAGADISDAIVDYKLEKHVSAPFNMVLGAQYQHNKNWMLRSEMGVFGKRSQFMVNLNYRFPGFKKTNN